MFTEIGKQIKSKKMLLYGLAKSKNKNRAELSTDGRFRHCGGYIGYKVDGCAVNFILSDSTVILRLFSDNIIKVTMLREGQIEKDSPAIYKKQWEALHFEVEESDSAITIKTKKMQIVAYKNNFKLEFRDEYGIVNEDYQAKGMGSINEKVCCYKTLFKEEHFYGFGEKTGSLDKRGWHTVNWNTDEPNKHDDTTKCLYISIPFYIGLLKNRAYGIYFDNTYKTYFEMGKNNNKYCCFLSDGGVLSYYFIYGPAIKDVVKGYTEITGRIEMPPLWTLGYQQCRWSYYPEKKVMEIANGFRERNIPCDTIYLDIDYMDGYRVFTWDKERFPDFKAMIDKLHEMGFKIVTIIDPGVKVDSNYDIYNEALERGYFIKKKSGDVFVGKVWPMDSSFPDFSREEVRGWWSGLQRRLIDAGVDGIWNDMNEPSVFDTETKTMPEDVLHGDDNMITHREFHNLYGMMMDKGTHDGIIDATGKRPYVLSRSGFAGVQRYAAVWTGDSMSLWEHLKLSIPMNCNLGLSGLPFIGNDVGGFGKDCTGELLARWTELGTFLPIFRNHSAIMTKSQEPWAFGTEVEKICAKYIRLRYRLLPYLYNLLYRSVIDGSPVIRPMVYEFQDDNKTYGIDDQFMFGSSILVAPVTDEGKREKDIYLPDGVWIDFWNGRQYKGGGYISMDVPLDSIPVFVKSGSIIPMWGESNFVGEKKCRELFIKIYPGCDTKYEYYEDDGISFDYSKGIYNLTDMEFIEKIDCFELNISKKISKYRSDVKEYIIDISASNEININSIYDCDGHTMKAMLNADKNTYTIKVQAKDNLSVKFMK